MIQAGLGLGRACPTHSSERQVHSIEHAWLTKHVERRGEGILSQNLATSNAIAVVRYVALLDVAGGHA
jgi:hypothetical protein